MATEEYERSKNKDGMLAGRYKYGATEFPCIVLACSLDGLQYLIEDLETLERYWCSSHLVEDND